MRSLLQHWVTEHAERRPEAGAIVMNEERVTYGQLEESSNRLARLLKSAGCKEGDRVCFLIPKSPAAYVSMLGILKADCVHVPMDTSSPAPRLARIVESCEPRFILGAGSVANLLDDLMSDDRFHSPVSIGQVSVGQVSVGQVSVGQVSVGQVSVGQVSVGQVSVGQVSVGWM